MTSYGYPPTIWQDCANCRYSRALKARDDVLSCRRNAPQLHGDYNSVPDSTTYGMWPAVFDDFWCGEWAPGDADQ